jgi:ABC-type glycerol-3-phosphate transport system substrate-binding protein
MLRRVVLCFLLLSLVACQMPSAEQALEAPTAKQIEIGFAGLQHEKAIYQPLIESFQATHPDIAVRFITLDDLLMGRAPDSTQQAKQIASHADTFSPLLIYDELLSTGAFLDLRPLLQADASFQPEEYPASLLAADQRAPLYQLPSKLFIQLGAYNRELWQASGLPLPEKTLSWNDLLRAAESLTVRNGDSVEVAGIDDGRNGWLILLGLLYEAGIELHPEDDGSFQLDQPEVATLFERVQDLIERGVIYRTQEDTIVFGDDLYERYRTGKVAIWLGGALLDQPEAERGIELEALHLPMPSELLIQRQGFAISSGTQHQEAAWHWVAFLSKQQIPDPKGMVIFGAGLELPARSSLAGDKLQKLGPEVAEALQSALAQPASPQLDRLVLAELEASLRELLAGDQQAMVVLQEHAERLKQQLLTKQDETAELGQIVVELAQPTAPPAKDAATISFPAGFVERAQLQVIAERFNQEQAQIFVQLEDLDGSQAMNLATLAERYDCFVWHASPSEQERTLVRDLQPLVDADGTGMASDLPPALLAAYRFGGVLYGLPYQVQLRSLRYNPDLFNSAGISYPEATWDYADLLEAAQQLTMTEGAKQQYGYAVQYAMSGDLLSFLAWRGLSPTMGSADSLEPAFTDEALLGAIKDYLGLIESSSPHTNLTGYKADSFSSDGMLPIMEGRVALWNEFSYNGAALPFVLSGPDHGEPRVALAPPLLGTRGLSSNDLRSNALYISQQSQQPEACWEWFRFLTSQAGLFNEAFPARRSVAQSPEFAAIAPQGASEVYAAYAPLLDQAQLVSANQLDLYWFFGAVDQALQGADLARALAQAEETSRAYLDCVRAGESAESCARSVDPNYAGTTR